MDETTASDIPSFLGWVNRLDDSMMFRGQASDWPLLPSIARPQMNGPLQGYSSWHVFQQDLIERFAKYARVHVQSHPHDVEEWLVHAQHHGLPTRLLDWSTNPLKALFWAVENRVHEGDDGVVWAFVPKYWRDDAFVPTPLDDSRLTPYFPKQLNSRLIAQEGCFVAFPLPQTLESLKPMSDPQAYSDDIESLINIVIPATAKSRLRRELRTLGISHRFVFPDLGGAVANILAELLEA